MQGLAWAGYGRWETLCTAAVASLLIVGALSIFHQSVSQLASSLGLYLGQNAFLRELFEGEVVAGRLAGMLTYIHVRRISLFIFSPPLLPSVCLSLWN